MTHKSDFVDLLDDVDETSKLFHSVNAIRLDENGSHGSGMDGKGAVKAMEEGGAKLNGINALLYGAGGISGVTAFELAQSGVKKLYIANRTPEKAEKIAASFLEDKPTWVRCNLHRADRESILASLKAQGTSVRELPFMESMIAIDGYDYLEGLDAFRKGWIQVQDVTSAFVGEIASPEKDSYIIDVCAAPGGKSLHLADKLEGTGMVEARDLTYQKTALIEENMARCGVTNMKTLVWDALETDLSAMAKADIVIADLPCSGLGIIGRKPDIKYNMTPEKLEELAGLQREILSVVWQYVKPGGLLCYSTCTIDRLENQDNAAWLRDRFPLVPVDLTDRFGGLPQEPSLKDGWIQFLPGVHPYDGFFISVFRRAEDETGPEGI